MTRTGGLGVARQVALGGRTLQGAMAITAGHCEATAHQDEKCRQQYGCAMTQWSRRAGKLFAPSAPGHVRRRWSCEPPGTAPALLAHRRFRDGAC